MAEPDPSSGCGFGELADACLLAGLAARAEAAGWDGWFLTDHVVHRAGDEPAVDRWMALAAAARLTSRIRLGPLVTPLPRRRPWNVARQAATLDRLSGGRAVLGVGVGSERTAEFAPLGEQASLAARAAMPGEGLDLLTALWSGELARHAGRHCQVEGVWFRPVPVQRPLPVWVAAIWPGGRPLRRAARWQKVFPVALPGRAALAGLIREVGPGKDIAVRARPPPPWEWEQAGATWWPRPLRHGRRAGEVAVMIDAGMPRR